MVQGARHILAAALLFSLMSLFVKLAGQRLSSLEIVLVRSVVTLALSSFLLYRRKIPFWGTHRRLLALRGVFGFVALSCFFYSVTQLPLAEATVIQFTNPVFTALFAAFFLGEKTTRRLWLSIALSLGGVLAITRPAILFGAASAATVHIPPAVVALGLGGAIATGIAYVLVRKLARLENEMVIVFYFPLVAVPASFLLLEEWVPPTPQEWLLLVGTGVTAQWGQIYLTRGMQELAAAKATVVLYSQLVFASLWGLLFLAQPPGWLTLAGAALVLAGSLLTARKTAPQPAPAVETTALSP